MRVWKYIFDRGTPKQWLFATIVFMVGFFGFLMMAGEDEESSIFQWLAIKALGFFLFLCSIRLGAFLDKKGLLPNCKDEED